MTQKSPSLEEVSRKGDGAERRRVPRLNLTTEQFRLARNGKLFSVADLSPGGMALRVLDGEDLALFPVGSVIDGILNLKREKYPVRARVRHLGMDLVGCEFEQLEAGTVAALQGVLDPEALGQDLRPIPVTENGATLWYHGPSGTDLLLWRKSDGQYHRFALFVLGSFAQWEEESGVSTGRVASSFEQSEVRGVVRFETLLLSADSKADSGKLAIAKKVVMSSNLPQELKRWCARQLGGNHHGS